MTHGRFSEDRRGGCGRGDLLHVVFVSLGLYCILYSPVLVVTHSGLVRPLVMVGLVGLLVHAATIGRLNLRIPIPVFHAAVGLFACLVMSQGLAFAGGSDPYLQSLIVAVFTGVLPLTFLLVWAVPQRYEVLSFLVRCTAGLGILQSVLILLDWWIPSVRDLFSKLVMQPELLDESYRAAGLTSMTGDGLSVSQAICAICAIYLAVQTEKRLAALGWALGLALILATLIFVGRTGFVLIAFFGVFLVVFHSGRKRILLGMPLVVGAFLGGVWLISVSVDERLASLFSQAFSSAFEAFIGLGEGGGFSTRSTEDLRTMVIFPETIRGWLIGYGFYSNPADVDQNYMGTDIGYLRVLFYVGLAGSAAIYGWYLAVSIRTFVALRKIEERVFSAGLASCFFVSQLKFSFLLLLAPMGFTLLTFFSAHRRADG